MVKKLIVLGGVAAGMSAASKARRVNPDAEITVYTNEEHISYAGCGLPYFIGGTVKSEDKLIARTIEEFKESNIDVKLNSEAISLAPASKSIEIKDVVTGKTFKDNYDKLVIATGARALVPPFEGVEKMGIFKLRNVNDGVKIKQYLEEYRPSNIVIIGGGYIGLEMVEVFIEKGCRVTLIERAPHILPNMDDDMANILAAYLEERGVTIRVGESVEAFPGGESVEKVKTDKGEIPADFVLLSIGVTPNTEFTGGSGVELGPRNAILVDMEMKTSIEDIYAAGDCATAWHAISGKDVYIPLGTTANKQGKIAGENAVGGHAKFNGVLGTGIARVLEMEVSRSGLSERECRELGIEYEARVIKSRTAAHYCPVSGSMHLKLVVDKENKTLIGAQIVGFQGAASRIDMLAVAMTSKATVEELTDMDLAYSPPFSPVWDPVLVALNQF